MMLDTLLFHAWYGPLRRPLRAVLRRTISPGITIRSGPLEGRSFSGPEATCRLGIYELKVQRELRNILRTGDVFYDLGANNGYLSLLAAACVGRTGRVYSFEPLPANIDRISELMRLNGVVNQETVPCAVSDQTGELRLYHGDDSDSYTPSLIRQERERELAVRATTLDDFVLSRGIDGLVMPDIVKMDVEGAELMVFDGASRLLNEAAPRGWLIEVHSVKLDRQVRDRLHRHGYIIRSIEDRYARREYPRHLVASRYIR